MRIPIKAAFAEMTERRSRFMAEVFFVSSQEEVREKIREQRQRWAPEGIRHLVHAFILGPAGEIQGCSDDGEPPGTAGRPVLEVLKGAGLTNALLTVARIFGGIKLGTGGLVQAYGESAKQVLAVTESTEWVEREEFSLQCSYGWYERVKQILLQQEVQVIAEEFSQQIQLRGKVRKGESDLLAELLREATRGEVVLVPSCSSAGDGFQEKDRGKQ